VPLARCSWRTYRPSQIRFAPDKVTPSLWSLPQKGMPTAILARGKKSSPDRRFGSDVPGTHSTGLNWQAPDCVAGTDGPHALSFA